MLVAVISALTIRTSFVAMAITMVMTMPLFIGMVIVTMRTVAMMAVVVECTDSNQGGQRHNNIGTVIVMRLHRADGHSE